MNENNQSQSQGLGSEGINATLQVATVITTSDHLITEGIEGKTLFTEPEVIQFGASQSMFIGHNDDDGSSDSEDASSVKQVGPSSLISVHSVLGSGAIMPSALTVANPQMTLEHSVSGASALANGSQVLEAVTQTASEETEERIEEEEVDEERVDVAEEKSNEDTQPETLAESVVEMFESIPVNEISALDALTEQVSDVLPVVQVPVVVEVFDVNEAGGSLESQAYTPTLNIAPIADVPLLSTGSSSQLFMSSFQEGAAGWQTDNVSGYLELNPETAYGGDNTANRALEVEAAAGDNSLYRVISTETDKTYQLNFEFAPRQGFPDSSIEVLWGGNVVETLDGSSGVFGWESYSLVLSGDGADKRLEFKATDHNGVGGLIDNIEWVELYATGMEDSPVLVSVQASLADTDGSEQLSLIVSELPEGASLSDGSHHFTASALETSVSISEWETGKLTITPPEHFNGVFDIVYTAAATEPDAGLSQSISETVTVTVLPVDAPLQSQSTVLGIRSAHLIIQESDQGSVAVDGRILSDNGFSSVDHWHIFHKGGALDVDAETVDGNAWPSSFRLFDIGAGGESIIEVDTATLEVSGSFSTPVFSLSDLSSGYYILAVGNEGFSEIDAFSLLDYANSLSGSHDYQLTITGNTEVNYIPANPDSYGQVQSQTYQMPEVQIQFVVDLNTESTINDTYYHFEVSNGEEYLSQGKVTFPSGENAVEITATINNRALDSVTGLDGLLVRFHEVDDGVIRGSQIFTFEDARNQAGDDVTSVDYEVAQALELMDPGLDMYELMFSELIDDMNNPLPG